ncbi:hypothetical protein N0V82_004076 [Gnomoniopsis sp. IMI 355080]|nr:hypothetical protein N0V82_004076 [Gnomoniopsis sp. IMI 355080]
MNLIWLEKEVAKEAVKAEGLTTLYQPEDRSEIELDIIFVHGLGGHSVRTWLHTSVNAETPSIDKVEPPIIAKPVRRVSTRNKTSKSDQAHPVKKRGNTLKKRPPSNSHAPPTREKGNQIPQLQLAEPGGEKTPDTKGKDHASTHSEPTKSLAKTGATIGSISPIEVDAYQESGRATSDTYWPLELLPKSCPSARICTYGFETQKVDGKLSLGQPDIFTRGRQLLEAMRELRRGCEPDREMVFIAHSTGGIVVKEMFRLASNDRDNDNEDLLAAVASVIFMGCPLSGTDYGSMIFAMNSMAAATTGVPIDDETLGKLLGGDEDAHLTYLGRDAFEALWREYSFRVKVYRETTTDDSPTQKWPALGLVLRRGASTLDDNLEEDEDLPGDHVNICKFESRRDDGYQCVVSYVARLAQYQALKRRHLSEKETRIQQALADPGASDVETKNGRTSRRELPTALSSTDPVVPHWLLQHPKVQTWLRRDVRENRHELLWLNGPPGSGLTELLPSLRAHLARHWAPEKHSSVIITITADEGIPPLDSVLFRDTDATNSHDCYDYEDNDKENSRLDHGIGHVKEHLMTRPKTSVTSAHETPQNASPMPNTPVRTLRSLLSQLYAYDPRLRNLVRKRTAAAGTLHTDDFSIETLFPIPNFPDPSKHHNVVCNSNPISTTENNTTTTITTGHLNFPTVNTVPLLPGNHIDTQAQGILDDADVWALFWEDYLCLGLPKREKQQQLVLNGKRTNDDDFKITLPGIRRVFILVDAAGVVDEDHLRGLLCWLRQLARRSEFSVCVASTATMLNGSSSSRSAKSPSESTLLIQVPEENAEDIRLYLDNHLVPDMEERSEIGAKMLDRSAGVMLWVEMVTTIVNEASEEGVSGEIILSMLDDIAPRRNGSEGLLDDLYAWKLRRLGGIEQSQALAVMQWVMLVPEPLRLNELLVALRLTLLACRRSNDSGNGRLWDISKTLEVEPAISMKELRAADGDPLGIGTTMMDSPAHFWKWLNQLSQGLLRLESEGSAESNISSEPLGLQRVRPTHESVRRFFLKGKGFQTLLPTPSSHDPHANDSLPSTDRFIDTSYYLLLHLCLVYLNITELDALGREKPPLNPAPGSALPPMEMSKWRAHADAQRRMVMSSYPLLRYIVDHLVFHLLCPRKFRYFLPQSALLALFTANRCRIWRRWTHLLGFSIADAAPEALLERAGNGPAGRLLAPVYGARYRLERVLRRVWRMALEQQRGGVTTPRTTPRRSHFRSRSDVSDGSMVFMLMGGEDPLKASWLVPTSPGRAKAVEAAPRALAGIEESQTGDKEGVNVVEGRESGVSV